MTPLRLNAVAFISPQNHPILIRTFVKQQDELKYHYIAHTSLDVIEERGATLGDKTFKLAPDQQTAVSSGAKSTQCYLGLLYTMEDVAVYGYVTPLKMKIVLALALSDSDVLDTDITTVRQIAQLRRWKLLTSPDSPDFQSNAYGLLFCHLEPVPEIRSSRCHK